MLSWPDMAANVLPVCRRSWKCSAGAPIAATFSTQRTPFLKLILAACAAGDPLPGLYAACEVSGFGGGGMHGYNSLEGTFLGGCLFSGRTAGRTAARAVG
jgi:succinate dehydrogenase/fumarate reductase flavoprotein subunit